MKFKMINDADAAILREARKILKKLKMREFKLNDIEDDTLLDETGRRMRLSIGSCLMSSQLCTSMLMLMVT